MMDGIGSLLFLFALDLITPGSETMLIVCSGAQGGPRSAYGVASGISFASMIYKYIAVLGFALALRSIPWIFDFMKYGGIVFFIAFAVMLIKKGFSKKEVLVDGQSNKGGSFQRSFIVGFVGAFLSPFALGATLSLLALTVKEHMSNSEALFLATVMVMMNFSWCMFVAWSSQRFLKRLLMSFVVRRALYFIAAVVFCLYAIRFALVMQ